MHPVFIKDTLSTFDPHQFIGITEGFLQQSGCECTRTCPGETISVALFTALRVTMGCVWEAAKESLFASHLASEETGR